MAALKKSIEKPATTRQGERRTRRQAARKARRPAAPAKKRARPRASGRYRWRSAQARHRDLQPQARLQEDRGAHGAQAQGQGRQLRRPEARRHAAALRLPARARRRAQELGGAQGARASTPTTSGWPCAPRTIRSTTATFEGTIPKGEYGGGTVMLWDRGRWDPGAGQGPAKTIEEGHLHFTLDGERMKGEWVMFRLKRRPGEKAERGCSRRSPTISPSRHEGDALVEDGRPASPPAGRWPRSPPAADVWRPNRGGAKRGRAKRKARPPPAVPAAAARHPGRRRADRHGWLHEINMTAIAAARHGGGGGRRPGPARATTGATSSADRQGGARRFPPAA